MRTDARSKQPINKFLCMALLMLLQNIAAYAQPAQDTSGFYWVTGYRSDSLAVPVYDSSIDPDDFPCARRFMFTTYAGEEVNFQANYLVPPDNPAQWYAFIYNEAHNQVGTPWAFYSNILLPYTFDTPGLYTINFLTHVVASLDTIVKCQVLVIPKIQNVWVEADPVCDDWTPALQQNDGKFHFKVKTYPDIDSIMRFIYRYTNGGTYPLCNTAESEELDFYGNAGVSVDPYLSGNQAFIYRKYSNPLPIGQYADLLNYYGSIWDSTHYPYPNDYYMFYAYDSINPGYNVFKDFLSGGPLYGDSLFINVHIKDGIDPDGWTVSAPVLIGQQYHLDDYTVTGTEVWTPTNNPGTALYGGTINNLRIKNRLYVNPGASLTVNGMTVEFGPDAWVIVHTGDQATYQPAGYLEMNNSTFTAMRACNNNSMWGGLNVEGKPNQTQESYYNGKAVMNNSTMSYSKYGFFPWDPAAAHTGGICIAKNSTFKRNTTSATLGRYHNINPLTHLEMHNESYFSNCEFINDTALPLPFRQFVAGTEVSGIYFGGCRFTSFSQVGKGINGVDMSILVDHIIEHHLTYDDTIKSSFTNLNRAISLAQQTKTAGLTLKHTLFEQDFYGAYLENVPVPLIKYDSFRLKSTYYGQDFDPYNTGIAIFSGSGYMVHDNSFIRFYPPIIPYPACIGVLLSNTGSSSNKINNNYYERIGNGNLSNYKNVNTALVPQHTGLQFLCNNYNSGGTNEAARGNDNTSQGIADWQGTPIVSAGNLLTGAATLYNLANEVGQFTYYYYGSPPTSTIGNILLSAASNDNTCIESADPDDNPNTHSPYDGRFGLSYRTIAAGHLTHPHLSDSTLLYPPSGGGTTYLSRSQVYYNIHHYLNDSVGMQHHDSLLFWTIQAQTAYTDLLLCDLMISDTTDSNTVFSVYDSISHWYSLDSVENREFAWGRKLMKMKMEISSYRSDTSRPGYIADSAWVSDLEQISDSANMWAKTMAQNWLTAFDGREFTHPVLYAIDSASDTLIGAHKMTFNNEVIGPVASLQQAQNNVYPNPVHDLLYINYLSESGNPAVLVISDVSGRVLKTAELSPAHIPASISLKGLKAGIYFYRVLENGKVMLHGKLAKD